MSMEVYVLSDARLASIAAWQQAIDASGFALQLSGKRPFADLQGALPVVLDGAPTAFECDHWQVDDLRETYSELDFKPGWTQALAFRWGADLRAGTAAYAAASCYAKATGGVVLDCSEAKFISWQRAAEISGELRDSGPMLDAAVRKILEGFRK